MAFWQQSTHLCVLDADASQLPFQDQTFDLVLGNLVLHWCADPQQAIGEWARLLRPGGLILLSTYGPDTLHELRHAFATADRASISAPAG